MSVTGIAALIAAVSFAVIAFAVVYLAIRATRVLGDAAAVVRQTRAGQEALLARAGATVDRANAQLDAAEAVNASMGELGEGMADLASQVNALAGFGRTMAGAVVGGPVGRAAALAYGVRHAVSLRRGGPKDAVPGRVVGGIEAGSPGVGRRGSAGRGTELSR
ncbi:MAG TPA: DUF948 domain-containing protein [Trebonia sp.]|nr:DUF948 domain-containing protein [Trebonia sp.]